VAVDRRPAQRAQFHAVRPAGVPVP